MMANQQRLRFKGLPSASRGFGWVLLLGSATWAACGSGTSEAEPQATPASSEQPDELLEAEPGSTGSSPGDANGGGGPSSPEGNPDPVGLAGSGGASGDSSGNGDGDGGDEAAPDDEPPPPDMPDPPPPPDPRPFFSFFVTSQAGLFSLPAGQFAPAPDPALGYGGNFGGLAGADEICAMLAQRSNPGDTKTWRAFLSTSGFDGGERVDAIDRIGPGPWYDFNGLQLAADVAGLLPEGDDGRPRGAVPQLADMFTDENGEDVQPNPQIDNHDTLTGSGPDGRLFDDGEGGEIATCQDWTSNTLRGQEGNLFGNGGQIPVGHSWPRNDDNGRQWMSDHTINGCEPGFDIDGGAGAPQGDFRVGAGGGYGAIYCFALGAVAPE